MFFDKCCLCGGKVMNGRCMDCGLRTDKNMVSYREVNGVWQSQKKTPDTPTLKERSASIHTRENTAPVRLKPISQRSTYQQPVYKQPVERKPAASRPGIKPRPMRLFIIAIIAIVVKFGPDVYEFGRELYNGIFQSDQTDYRFDQRDQN